MRRFFAVMALGLGGLLGFSSPAGAATGTQSFALFGSFDEDATMWLMVEHTAPAADDPPLPACLNYQLGYEY